MKRTYNFLTALLLTVVLQGCGIDDEVMTPREQLEEDLRNVDQAQLAIDTGIIDSYLGDNNLVAKIDDSGLRYIVHDEGSGIIPELNDIISVAYTGLLLSDGSVFDSSDNTANGYVRFELNRLILGWKVGFLLLKEGTKATLYLPSGLGYGPGGNPPSIPPNANLIFEVELLDVSRAQ